jgi:hypothetical protein
VIFLDFLYFFLYCQKFIYFDILLLKHNSDIIDEIVLAVVKDESVIDKKAFQKLCNAIYAQTKLAKTIPSIAFIERYHEMVSDARISPSPRVERVFRKRGVRNQSGIAVISLLTKFW